MESTKTGEYVSPEGSIEVPERKICPILMAGATSTYFGTSNPTTQAAISATWFCIGDKCEWFDNGCPAHPRLEFEPGSISSFHG